MKPSDKTTPYILVKANTSSDWDSCDFAIIHVSEEWKRQQLQRLEHVRPFEGNCHFCSMCFYDTAVDFYKANAEDQPDIEELLAKKAWAFVELEKGEEETFSLPENRLNCYRLVLHTDGTFYYTASGKYNSEEFWTEEIPLKQFIRQ